ncbi:MAG: ribonuclease Y [Candidatus Anammoxibacter sp.]
MVKINTSILIYILPPICILLGYLLSLLMLGSKTRIRENKAKTLVEDAKMEAVRLRKDAEFTTKERLFKEKEAFEKETHETKQELRQTEKRLSKRDDNLERKLEILTKKERNLEIQSNNIGEKENKLDNKNIELDGIIEEEKKKLLSIVGLSKQEAEGLLLSRLEKDLDQECAKLINRKIQNAKETADEKARSIVCTSIQRCASGGNIENVVSSIPLPNNDLKGRIIGREGRNIRAFEKATGIDVIVDDTPGIIVLSGFDSIRRELARITMEKLILDGRIHPARIEEIVEETKKELEQTIMETGKQTCLNMNIHNVHPEIIKLIGKLKYRTSYGQNQLQHSIEVANICGMLAGELKLDIQIAKRGGLFHDIGKAISLEVEGTHAIVGSEIARKRDECFEVVNAIASHHEEVPMETVYSVLCLAADSLSGGRPGARRETFEKYVKRLEKLESIATSFGGIESAYAIQAGREIRVIVRPNEVDDKMAAKICYDMAKEIEAELEYPGEVTVTVIRETRCIEKAK